MTNDSNRDAMLSARELGKRYGRRWALSDCDLDIPSGCAAGLLGANGAGKTTLLELSVGLLAPTSGSVTVLGARPGGDREQLGRIGFVGQQTPTYPGLSVGDHLRLGRHLNPRWDDVLATRRIGDLGLDPTLRAGRLSGGQRAQLALTLALAKRPELLVLDEPVASLDPVARREFIDAVSAAVTDRGLSVLFSSHLVSDVERVCDFLVVLAGGRVRLADSATSLHVQAGAGSLEDLLLAHMSAAGRSEGVA